jgi:uncharacterized protein (DUF433 family)
MDYIFPEFSHIAVNEAVCTGKPRITGTRITVSAILAYLAGGMTEKQLLKDFPKLTKTDIQQALSFASAMMQEKIIPLKSAS